MKNANKGQQKSKNGFMTLLLFLKTAQCKTEIWEEALHRLHLLGFKSPHFRAPFPVPPFGLGQSLLLLWREQEHFWLSLIAEESLLKNRQRKLQGRPRARPGTGTNPASRAAAAG